MDPHPLPPPALRNRLLLAVAAGLLLPALAWLGAELAFGARLGLAPERVRAGVLLLVVVQVVASAAALLWTLVRHLDDPLDRLTGQVQCLLGARPVAPLRDALGDELQPLTHELEALRQRIADLQGRLRTTEAQLHKASMLDALTGLPNRVLMSELFTHEAAAARRAGRAMAMLHLGLDRFRTFNDTLGHNVGDELLIGIAGRLTATLRDADVLCRGGGDEFLVLLSGTEGWDRVAAAAERLLRAVERPLELPRSGHVISVSAGIGIAMYPADGTDFEALARTAALALDRSKALGRGLYSFYQPGLDQALRQRIETERELALALENDEFMLVYQPVLDARSGATVGCEALLRWQHPRRGLLAPGAFIEGARACALMCDIDAWVLERACRDLAQWRAAGIDPGRVALNLSVQQARNPALSDTLRTALERHALQPQQLELEITEDAFMHETDGVPRALARWRALGLALTIDDFGVGYSSLSQLKKLRPERLKIDCSLVAGLPDAAEDCALAEAMLGMARALQIGVVAEGVETAAQRDWLLQRGCVRQQGHLHGEPLPAVAFAARLGLPARRSALPTGAAPQAVPTT